MKFAILGSAIALVCAMPHPELTASKANKSKPAAVEANAKKLPYIQKASNGGIYCGKGGPDTWFEHTDKNCGTKKFCSDFDDQRAMRDYLQAEPSFKSAEDCFNAHEPKPAAVEANAKKLPYILKASDGGRYCGSASDNFFEHTDESCGTKKYCLGFDDQQAMRDYLQGLQVEPRFKSAEDCFNAHKPEPAAKANKSKPAAVEANAKGPSCI
ncbi:hypothetical protein QQS21_006780 [Conoideocrella luteorostrata]|uniref:Uncharacterized protein n=1 Tax=Conoideocrella luteorostrata TaxID=1105319 RepID=A0AAJ0CLY2_9HYPO|nr:hypothetical protein QQS21_006780 [Conoideocrella luteorostrata]